MTFAPFTPALGLEVDFRGHRGVISFISDVYLTVCLKKREGDMIGDVCMVVYAQNWDEIELLGSHNRQ